MRTILVTGGAGYVGSHICCILLKKGFNVVVVDSLINSKRKVIDKLRELSKTDKNNHSEIYFVKGDIRDYKLLDEIFKKYKISSVIHCAGLKAVAESVVNPIIYWEVNVYGSINLFKAMENNSCFNIVFSSSATVYGHPEKVFVSEDSKLIPLNPYGETKLTIEKILNDLYKSCPSKWKIANLRYFNPIGAHPSGLIGEDPSNTPNNIFPIINQVAIRKINNLKVFGNNWPTPDGTGVRDYIHVMDLADGHIAALNFLYENQSQILNLNLGTGVGTSVLELIEIYQKVNECEIPYEIAERRAGDVACIVANNEFALELLDWVPSKSIEQMCLDGWSYQKNNFN